MASDVEQRRPNPDSFAPEREQVRALMQRAGLLVEPSPATRASGARATLTLEEAAEILSRGDAPSLTEQLDDERGPRD